MLRLRGIILIFLLVLVSSLGHTQYIKVRVKNHKKFQTAHLKIKYPENYGILCERSRKENNPGLTPLGIYEDKTDSGWVSRNYMVSDSMFKVYYDTAYFTCLNEAEFFSGLPACPGTYRFIFFLFRFKGKQEPVKLSAASLLGKDSLFITVHSQPIKISKRTAMRYANFGYFINISNGKMKSGKSWIRFRSNNRLKKMDLVYVDWYYYFRNRDIEGGHTAYELMKKNKSAWIILYENEIEVLRKKDTCFGLESK